MPGAPDKLRTARVGEGAIRVTLDASRAAAVEEEGEGEEVGSVEASDANGEKVVERDGGVETDEREQAGYGRGQSDAVDREGCATVKLEVLVFGSVISRVETSSIWLN